MSEDQHHPVDRDRLREIVERANKASEGPWYARPAYFIPGGVLPHRDILTESANPDEAGKRVAEVFGTDDFDFIAHAREDIPDLAEALERAWGEKEAAIRTASTLMLQWRDLFREVLREHRPDEEDFCTCREHFRPEDMPEAWIEHVISLVEEKARDSLGGEEE